MFCPCLFTILPIHTIPNISFGLDSEGLIFGTMFTLVYRGPIFGGLIFMGAYIWDFTVSKEMNPSFYKD